MQDPSRGAALIVGTIVSVAGALVFVASAATMVVLWVSLLSRSMGWLGVLLGVSSSPMAAVYPFLHWLARSEFPQGYFAVWMAGIAGLAVSLAWATYGRHKLSRGSFRTRVPRADERRVIALRVEDGSAD